MKNKFPPTHKRKFPYFKLLITCKLYFLKTHGIEERNNNSLIKQNRPKTKIFQLTVWHVCECLILLRLDVRNGFAIDLSEYV